MKYIGPFLKLNYLSKQNIENQLFHLAKESEKMLIFHSKFGIVSEEKYPRYQTKPNNDIITFESFSPLLCIYRKADAKLLENNNKLAFDNDKLKKEVPIFSNAYMTLSLLELAKYYKSMPNSKHSSKNLYDIYMTLAENQLEFYLTYLRNYEGVFTDKKDISEEKEFKFENCAKNFVFSDQCSIMCAFYLCSILSNNKYKTQYETFAFDIFKVINGFKDTLYSLPSMEILKICISLNVFYSYSKNKDVLLLLLDLYDYAKENFDKDNLQEHCFFCINSFLLYKNTDILKFKDNAEKCFKKLLKLYDTNTGILEIEPEKKDKDKKEKKEKKDKKEKKEKKDTKYSAVDLLSYLLCSIICFKEDETSVVGSPLSSFFKTYILESGIIESWPKEPAVDNIERYKNFSMSSGDLLREQDFKMQSIKTPEENLTLPVFLKEISYSKKKGCFSNSKTSFNTSENMFFFFLFIYLFAPNYNVKTE